MAFLIRALSCWLFQVYRHPLQQGFQGTGLFARGNQVAIQFIEVAWLFAQCCRQVVTGGDLLFQALYQRAHLSVFEAFADDVEGLQQRYAGPQQCRQLAGEQGNVCGFYRGCKAWQVRGLFAYAAGADSLLAQLHLDQHKVLASGLP